MKLSSLTTFLHLTYILQKQLFVVAQSALEAIVLCEDYPSDWVDATGVGCDWYRQYKDSPVFNTYCDGYANQGLFARDVCCACPGGGRTNARASSITDQIVGDDLEQVQINSTTFKALNWIIVDDEYQIRADSRTLIQRYSLAKLYYELNGDDWNQCSNVISQNESNNGDNDENLHVHECVTATTEMGISGVPWLSPIPECEWAFIECSRDEYVMEMRMVANGARGVISYDLVSGFPRLTKLSLRLNHLTGSIPTYLSEIRTLNTLNLYGNSFSGTIPEVLLTDALELQYLNLGSNLLSGTISSNISNLKQLRFLRLSSNNITGTIPSSLGDLELIETVILNDMALEGSVPHELCKLRTERTFDENTYLQENPFQILRTDCSGSVFCDEECCTDCSNNYTEQCSDITVAEVEYWYDAFNITCDEIEETYTTSQVKEGCYTDPGLESFNLTASDVCCFCRENNDPSIAPSSSPNLDSKTTSKCENIKILPFSEHDSIAHAYKSCRWFEINSDECPNISRNILYELHSQSKFDKQYARNISAYDACCACGGGYSLEQNTEVSDDDRSYCLDYPGFIDSHEFEPYTCFEYLYTDTLECQYAGNAHVNLGHTARTACCICGGGTNNTLIPDNETETCYDFSGWQDTSKYYSCSNFSAVDRETRINFCAARGSLVSPHNTSAKEACCGCEDSVGNTGGYTGILRGKIFRVGYVGPSDIPYLLSNTTNSTDIVGSFFDFSQDIFRDYGIYTVDVNPLSDWSQMIYGDDTADQCLNDLSLNLVDFCMWPYPNVELSHVRVSDPFLKLEYILVVRNLPPMKFRDGLAGPFLPMETDAWVVVFAILILMSFVLSWTQESRSRNLIKRVLNGIFHGFNSLSGGSVSNTPEKPRASDKVIVTGLAFFIFIVVVAYGGSNAANLVNDREIGEFLSIDELIQKNKTICIMKRLEEHFETLYPEVDGNVFGFKNNDFSYRMLQNLRSKVAEDGEKLCDAVVISREELEANALGDIREWDEEPEIVHPNGTKPENYNKLCDLVPLLFNDKEEDVLFTIEIVAAFSPSLGIYGDEIIDRFNYGIKAELFETVYEESKSNYEGNFVPCEFDIDGDGEKIGLIALSFPIIFSLSMMLVGILVHIYTQRFLLPKREISQNAQYNDKHIVNDLLILILLKYIRHHGCVDEVEIVEAVENLPDKSRLLDLGRQTETLIDRDDHKLNVVQVVNILEEILESVPEHYYNNVNLSDDEIDQALSSVKPMNALINLIDQKYGMKAMLWRKLGGEDETNTLDLASIENESVPQSLDVYPPNSEDLRANESGKVAEHILPPFSLRGFKK